MKYKYRVINGWDFVNQGRIHNIFINLYENVIKCTYVIDKIYCDTCIIQFFYIRDNTIFVYAGSDINAYIIDVRISNKYTKYYFIKKTIKIHLI